jgi:hypothetical protein
LQRRASQRPAWLHLAAQMLLGAAFFLSRPYPGISGDAQLYVGRALADLDPGGVGGDLAFALDGQSAFSVFPAMLRHAVAWLGAPTASIWAAGLALALWWIAAVVLARRLLPDRFVALGLWCLALLPAGYGSLDAFHYAEPLATPRPLAEAAAMGAFAAALAGRRWLALALVGVGLAIHPPMALPAAAVLFVMLALEDRRWLLLIPLGVLIVLAAAVGGLPVAARLFKPIDPSWLDALYVRSTYLFATRWPEADWALITTRAVTVVIGSAWLMANARRLAVCILAVTAGGVLAALLFGDLLPSQLVVQIMPWRALWLLTLTSNALFGLAVVKLWRTGPNGRVVLSALLLAWVAPDLPGVGLAAATACVALYLLHKCGRLRAQNLTAWVALGTTLFLAAVVEVGRVWGMLFRAVGEARAGDALDWPDLVAGGVLTIPAVAAGLAVALAGRGGWRRESIAGASALVAAAVALVLWTDARALSQWNRAASPDLARLVGRRSGPVMWVDGGADAWFVLHRPNWYAPPQCAGVVFSRELALGCRERARQALALGLADRDDFIGGLNSSRMFRLDAGSIGRLCRRPDAPAAVIVPAAMLADRDLLPGARTWRAPSPRYLTDRSAGTLTWIRNDAYTVVRCAAFEGAASSAPIARAR